MRTRSTCRSGGACAPPARPPGPAPEQCWQVLSEKVRTGSPRRCCVSMVDQHPLRSVCVQGRARNVSLRATACAQYVVHSALGLPRRAEAWRQQQPAKVCVQGRNAPSSRVDCTASCLAQCRRHRPRRACAWSSCWARGGEASQRRACSVLRKRRLCNEQEQAELTRERTLDCVGAAALHGLCMVALRW